MPQKIKCVGIREMWWWWCWVTEPSMNKDLITALAATANLTVAMP